MNDHKKAAAVRAAFLQAAFMRRGDWQAVPEESVANAAKAHL
ncbi:hypothetical protein [Paraburkholderia sp. J12]|nr:hypothetical protein [Paraburkholderia sp. J12]